MTKAAQRRIDFANGTLGCLTASILVIAFVAFWLAGFADLSGSTSKGAQLFVEIQRARIGNFPLGATILAGYLLFEGARNGWRWADRTAMTIDSDQISIHPSYRRKSIALENVVSVASTRQTSTWVKSINPAIIIRWRDGHDMGDRKITIRNLNLDSLEARAAIAYLKGEGKWLDDQ